MYLCVYLCYWLCLFHDSVGGNESELLLRNKDQDVAELKTLVAELKTLVEHQNTKISDQNTRILHIKDQDIHIAELKTQIKHQNTIIAEFKALIEHQNTKVAEFKTLVAEIDTKMCKLDSEIEKLKNSEAVKASTEPTAKQTTTASTSSTSSTTTTASNTNISSHFSVSGVVFTRWGRSDCPEYISTSVYNGTTGGSSHLHSGGAVNYVCMPHDPIWDENKHYNGPQWGYLYGGEYKELPNFAGKSLTNYEVPCSVCRSTAFSTKLMIPGRNTCYPGWTKAYYAGELNSGYYNHPAASEYACLDRQPQTIGSNTNLNGVLFYPVRAVCGSLPCPPYEDNTLLTCVVCLK